MTLNVLVSDQDKLYNCSLISERRYITVRFLYAIGSVSYVFLFPYFHCIFSLSEVTLFCVWICGCGCINYDVLGWLCDIRRISFEFSLILRDDFIECNYILRVGLSFSIMLYYIFLENYIIIVDSFNLYPVFLYNNIIHLGDFRMIYRGNYDFIFTCSIIWKSQN